MLKNPGRQLKGLAMVIFAITVVAGVGFGLNSCLKQESIALKALIVFVSVVSSIIIGWLSSIFIYAFGELCENVDRIANEYYDNNLKAKPKKKAKKTVKVIQSESKTDNEDEMTPENYGFLD